MLLFIYGTLKRGFPYHHLLKGELFLGEGLTEPRYQLLDCGDYPALLEVPLDGAAVSVWGELWKVTDGCLKILNGYEGPEYDLRPVLLQAPRLDAESAMAYVFRENPGLPDIGTEWLRGGSHVRDALRRQSAIVASRVR